VILTPVYHYLSAKVALIIFHQPDSIELAVWPLSEPQNQTHCLRWKGDFLQFCQHLTFFWWQTTYLPDMQGYFKTKTLPNMADIWQSGWR